MKVSQVKGTEGICNGGSVPLSQIADLEYAFEDGIIWHRDRLPTVTVRATVPDDVQANDVAGEVYAKLASLRSSLPDGYSIAIQGGAEDAAESQASIAATRWAAGSLR